MGLAFSLLPVLFIYFGSVKGFGLVPGATLPCNCVPQVAEGAPGGRPVAEQDGVSVPHTPHSDRALQSPGGRKVREKSGRSLTEPISPRGACFRQSNPAEKPGQSKEMSNKLQDSSGDGQPMLLWGGQQVFLITRC